MFEKDGILFHRSRIIDGHHYTQAAGMGQVENLSAQGINCYSPVIDRFSLLAYAMADWIHCKVAIHSGFESTDKKSLDYVFILQGFHSSSSSVPPVSFAPNSGQNK